MSPGGHLVTTAVAGGVIYASTGSAELLAGFAAGGFLIDVDHAVDYVLFERQRDLRPGAFLRYYLSGNVRRVVLLLHSYEVLALLALLAWATNWVSLWGYLLGAALHLPLDIVFNGRLHARSLVPFYSFAYRCRRGFRAADLIGLTPTRPAGAGFWRSFFLGAVRLTSGAAPSEVTPAAAESPTRRPSPRGRRRASPDTRGSEAQGSVLQGQ
jgi:hypothetical protein